MPSIGARCHALRVRDENRNWRLIYRIDPEEIVLVSVFSKTTRATTKRDIDNCKQRLKTYDQKLEEAKRGAKK
jgi:phage-related protein